MIDYQTYCQIRHLLTEKKLGLRQIARELKLGLNTVRKWAGRESFKPAAICPALGCGANRPAGFGTDRASLPGRCPQ